MGHERDFEAQDTGELVPFSYILFFASESSRRALKIATGGGFRRSPAVALHFSPFLASSGLWGLDYFTEAISGLFPSWGPSSECPPRGHRSWQASMWSSIRAQGCHLQNSTDTGIRSLLTDPRAQRFLNILKGQCRDQRGEETTSPLAQSNPAVPDKSPVLSFSEHLHFL